jgi:NTP pyrophosphatase (non-canonical NTP hydrolase)
MSEREILTVEDLELAVENVRLKMLARLEEKGPGAYSSRHECLGIVEEEMHELVEAVRSGRFRDVINELMDVAVGCVFGIASIESGKVDW